MDPGDPPAADDRRAGDDRRRGRSRRRDSRGKAAALCGRRPSPRLARLLAAVRPDLAAGAGTATPPMCRSLARRSSAGIACLVEKPLARDPRRGARRLCASPRSRRRAARRRRQQALLAALCAGQGAGRRRRAQGARRRSSPASSRSATPMSTCSKAGTVHLLDLCSGSWARSRRLHARGTFAATAGWRARSSRSPSPPARSARS